MAQKTHLKPTPPNWVAVGLGGASTSSLHPWHCCLGHGQHFFPPLLGGTGAGLLLPCRHFSAKLKSFYSEKLSKTSASRMIWRSLSGVDSSTAGFDTGANELLPSEVMANSSISLHFFVVSE